MKHQEILDKLTHLDERFASHYPVQDTALKSSVGFGSAFAALSINDWMGLLVGLATLIYMIFQIEQAYVRRKKRKQEDAKKNEHES